MSLAFSGHLGFLGGRCEVDVAVVDDACDVGEADPDDVEEVCGMDIV